jgi:hypothetical protein
MHILSILMLMSRLMRQEKGVLLGLLTIHGIVHFFFIFQFQSSLGHSSNKDTHISFSLSILVSCDKV